VGALPDASTGGGKRDSGVDAAASDGPSGVFGTIVLDPIAAGDLANWTPPAVNSNPTMTFEEIVSPYDSGVALRTTATGTTLMACPVEYTSRDFQLPGSVSSAAYALQLYLALDSDMTTYNWPGLQVDLLSGGAVVADIQYYSAAATGTFIMQRTASWHAIANNGFQALPLSPLLDSSGAVIPTPVTFDKIRITMVNYTCIGTNSVIIDQLSLVPTDATGSGGSRDGGVGATGGVDAAGGAGGNDCRPGGWWHGGGRVCPRRYRYTRRRGRLPRCPGRCRVHRRSVEHWEGRFHDSVQGHDDADQRDSVGESTNILQLRNVLGRPHGCPGRGSGRDGRDRQHRLRQCLRGRSHQRWQTS